MGPRLRALRCNWLPFGGRHYGGARRRRQAAPAGGKTAGGRLQEQGAGMCKWISASEDRLFTHQWLVRVVRPHAAPAAPPASSHRCPAGGRVHGHGSLTAPAAMRQSQFPFLALSIACGTAGLHPKPLPTYGQSSAQPGQPRPLGPAPAAHKPQPRLCSSLDCCADLSKRQGAEPGWRSRAQVRHHSKAPLPLLSRPPALSPASLRLCVFGVVGKGRCSTAAAGRNRPIAAARPAPPSCSETRLDYSLQPSMGRSRCCHHNWIACARPPAALCRRQRAQTQQGRERRRGGGAAAASLLD